MNVFKSWMAAMVLCWSTSGHAAADYIGGTIDNITTGTIGVLVMVNSGVVPTNCQGTPYGWMLVKESNKTMVAMVLTMWAIGKRQATVYTQPSPGAGGYCEVTQVDPSE